MAGSDLISTLSEGAAQRGRTVFLLGGNPGVAEQAADELRQNSPGLRIAGTACPPMDFETDPVALEGVRSTLAAAMPDIVFIGVSFPRSALIAETLRRDLPNTWFVGVGISLSFVAGEISRAPKVLQVVGLEWVHRLVQEPTRLFERYIMRDLPFAGRVVAHSVRQRLRGGALAPLTTRRPPVPAAPE